MSRHANQTKGLAAGYRPSSKQVAAGHTDAKTSARDAKRLDDMRRSLPKKPPHAHRWVNHQCSVCLAPQIEST